MLKKTNMTQQLKEWSEIEKRFEEFIVKSPAGYPTQRLISGKYKVDAVYEDRIGIDGITTKEVADWWLSELLYLLTRKSEEIEGLRRKFAKDADTETHGAYFIKGRNSALTSAQAILLKGIK